MSADVAFERAADAAAAAFAATPPYVSYRVDVYTDTAALHSDESNNVVVRTADGQALVSNARGGDPKFGAAALPLSPAVDALADWAFAFEVTDGHVRLNVAYVRPKYYSTPTPGPGVTVVVPSVSGYALRYVNGETNHVHLEPATTATRAFAAQRDHFVYSDVWFDPVTFLPTRVVLRAIDETLALDYTIANGHWLLRDFTYDALARSKREGARRYRIDAQYADYAFPEAVPELER